MKNIFPIASLSVALMLTMATTASAQLSWAGGSGTWDNSTANWFNGTSNVVWVPGDTGTFTNTNSVVTVSGTQTASQLTFNTSNPIFNTTLVGGALGINASSGNLIIESDGNGSDAINSNINNLGSTGTLTKTGTSTLTLGGSNTFSTLAINAGTVSVNSVASSGAQPVGKGNITLGVAGTSSGTFSFGNPGLTGSYSLGSNITASGNGADTVTLGGTMMLILTGTTTINGPSLTLSSTAITSNTGTLFTTVQGEFQFTGPILAAPGSVLNVSTAVILGSANNTIQTINISRFGSVALTASNTLPSDTAINFTNGGNLELGTVTSGSVNQTISSLTGTGLIANVSSAGTSNFTINNSTTDTFNGTIGVTTTQFNNLSLTKTGTGTLILTAKNYYSGGTVINAGAIVISQGTTTNSGTIANGGLGLGLVTLNNGSTLEDNGTGIQLANAVSVSGTVTFASTGSGGLDFDGTSLNSPPTFQITGDTTLNVTNSTSVADNISNTGNYNLTKSGSGTLTLTGTSSSAGTGSTTVTAGTLAVGSSSNLGSGTISLSGSTSLQYVGATGTFSQNITVTSGSVTLSNNAIFPVVLTLAGTVSIDGTTLNVQAATLPGKVVINGPVVGSSPNSNINYIGSSDFGVTAAGTYNGATSISGGGVLLLGLDNALPNGTAFIFGATGESGHTNKLDLLGHSLTVSSLIMLGGDTDTITSSNGSATNPLGGVGASATTGNLTVNFATGTDTYTGSLASNLSLTKSGTGTLILTRNNTYTGGTMVSSGTLTVSNTSGSATGTGTISVSNGAALTGSGTITSTHIAISGNLQPGTGGSDTAGIMTLTSTSTAAFTSANLVFNLNAATPGQSNELVLNATPSVLFTTSTLTLNLQNGSPSSGISEYTLLTSTTTGSGVGGSIFGGDISYDSSTGIVSGLNLAFNTPGYSASYLKLVSNGSGGYNLDIEVQAVPEPGTWLLLLGGLCLLRFGQLRRQR